MKKKIVERKATMDGAGTSQNSWGIGDGSPQDVFLKAFQPGFDPFVCYSHKHQQWCTVSTAAEYQLYLQGTINPIGGGETDTALPDFHTHQLVFHHTNRKELTPSYGLNEMTALVASGLTVIQVSLQAGANNKAKLLAAIAAATTPGDIVWIDIAGFNEVFNNEINITVPIHLIGYSRDPSQTVLKADPAGGSQQSIIKVGVGGTSALWKDRMVVANLTVDGDDLNATDDSVNVFGLHHILSGKSHITIENCVAENCFGFGYNVESLTVTEDMVYKDCVARNCAHGFKAGGGTINGLQLLNCLAHDCRHHPSSSGTTGAGFFIRPLCDGLVMKDCAAISNQETGFQTEQFTSDSLVENCLFENNGWDINAYNPAGIKIGQGDGEHVDGLTFKRCVFRHNGLRTPFTDAGGNDRGMGILFKTKTADTKNVLIEDCTFDNNGHIGVHYHGRDSEIPTVENFVIKNCNFLNHSFAGVGIDDLSNGPGDIEITAIGNYWGSKDGSSGTGAGTGDPTLHSTPFGAKRVTDEGETLQQGSIILVNP